MAPEFYSKKQKLQKIVYKVSASGDFDTLYPPYRNMTDANHGCGASVTPWTFPNELVACGAALTRTAIFEPKSGSFVYNTLDEPREVEFDVAEYGKIIDIKVWVEFLHDTCGMHGAFASGPTMTLTDLITAIQYKQGDLANTAVFLRSPNVNFESAFPLLNNKKFKNTKTFYNRFASGLTPSVSIVEKRPSIMNNSYVLWCGKNLLGTFIIGAANQQARATWNSDFHMRTIFTDSSPNKNPLHFEHFYTNPTLNNGPGIPILNLSASANKSPNQTLVNILGERDKLKYIINWVSSGETYEPIWAPKGSALTGGLVPWFYDNRLWESKSLQGNTSSLGNGWADVPTGWFSAPPNGEATTVENEFYTQGQNLGPDTIKPLYPLLSDVMEVSLEDSGPWVNTLDGLPASKKYDSGFRPGLKGTEVHGKWKLLLAQSYLYGDEYPNINISYPQGIWFRQARIEFTIEQGEDGYSANSTLKQRYNKKSSPTKNGKKLIHIMSGTYPWADPTTSITYTYEVVPEQYGRAVGITSNKEETDFAVFTRITGALQTNLEKLQAAGSGYANVWTNTQADYLGNEFGTPYIPISSGSGVSASFEPFSQWELTLNKEMKDNVFKKRTLASEATIPAVLSKTKFYKSSANMMIEEVEKLYSFNEDDYDENKGIL
jgi:hypothetical protein